MMLPVRLTIHRAAELGDDVYDEMHALYRHSHDTDRATFEAKTKRKFHEIAILRRRESGALVSFLGARAEDVEVDGRRVHALYMGQAMTAPSARRSGLSLLCPLAFTARAVKRSLRMPVVGWQDALTVRTFLLVARFADEYYPHPRLQMSADVRALRDHLGRAHYGDDYDAAQGIVRKPSRLVLEEDIRPEKLADEHIGFYARANPGYVRGDGLLQVFPLSVGICLKAALRLMWRTLRPRVGRWTSRRSPASPT